MNVIWPYFWHTTNILPLNSLIYCKYEPFGVRGASDHNFLSSLRPFQKMIVVNPTSFTTGVIKEYVLELLFYQGKRELYEQLKPWCVPKLPVTGKHLTDAGVPSGRKMGLMLQRFREIWAESHFRLTAAELLTQLPEVLNGFEEARKTSPILNKTIKKRK